MSNTYEIEAPTVEEVLSWEAELNTTEYDAWLDELELGFNAAQIAADLSYEEMDDAAREAWIEQAEAEAAYRELTQ
jgi:hypothetical protein